MNKKSLGGSTILIVLGLIFIAITGLRTISTPEIWTHLAQGRTNAPISFLASDSVVNTTWLYDKMAYMMYNIGNAPLLIILNIVGLLTAFVLLLQVSKKWGGNISQGFALLFTGHLIFQSLDVGPQVVMMLFLALFLFLLSNVKSPVVLFCALIPLQIIWTNMHGSFLYGPIIAALAAIQATRSSKGSKSNMKQPGMLGILTAALVVSTAANPYFFKMHAQVMASILSPMPVYWSSLFIEYFQIPALKPLIFFLVILGAAGLLTLKKNLPVVLTTLAIFGAFLVWTSPHHAMLFAVFAFPFIVLSLTSVSGYLHGSMSNILGKNDKIILPATGCVLAVLLIVSMIPIITNSAFERTGSASSFGLGVQENLYPADCEAIINHPVFPAAEKTINLAADGGYLAFKYNRKCFIDYRSGRYDREVLTNLTSM
ncbi:MAG: hypothetical protein OES84_00670, partial [Kiritimatiellaceae bacterium]|nr:hypothetical protein [Kiritimatiellaceae bacterium]